MSLKFYTDTHIPKQVAVQLREKGIEVIRCEEVGLATASDAEHLQYAASRGLSIITKDDDFLRLHARWMREGKKHAGIFFSAHRFVPAIGEIVSLCAGYYELVEAGAATAADIHNQTIFI
jgi:hypothetical protein